MIHADDPDDPEYWAAQDLHNAELREEHWRRSATEEDTTMETTEETTMIPTTREEAIAQLVEQDVARWGEAERAASQRAHLSRSYGRALNELANRAELADAPDPALRAAARAAMTSADRDGLYQGG